MVRALLNALFVPSCAACDARSGDAFCHRCAESLYPVSAACPRCGLPQDSPVAVLCARCRRRPPPFLAAYAAFRYGGELATALQRLKYDRRMDIARSLAPLLCAPLAKAGREVDVAMPVPLHWGRMASRGFNQAALLLQWAGRGLMLRTDMLSLRRVRRTRAQQGLLASERRRNVEGAFAVVERRRHLVTGKRVLLVDDIMTTGATMAAASRALLHAGAASVTVFAAARAEV